MLIKSFFRNKTTKIYIVIITILITALLFLSSILTYLNTSLNKLFYNNSFIIISSKIDYSDYLNNNSHIISIQKGISAFSEDFIESIISDIKFNEITNDNYYTYKVLVDNKKYADKLVNYLKKISNEENDIFMIYTKYKSLEESNKIIQFENLISTLSIMCFISSIFILIIILIIFKNIYSDSKPINNIFNLLGYSKKRINNIMLINFSILLVITIIFSNFINFILKNLLFKA